MLWLLTHSLLANAGWTRCPCLLDCASLKRSITFAPFQPGRILETGRWGLSIPPTTHPSSLAPMSV